MNRAVFFLPDVVGGVFSVVNNLVKYAPSGSSSACVAYSNRNIARKQIDASHASTSVSKFSFDGKDNLYSIARRLKAELPADTSCIVATDYPELMMIQLCRLKMPVVYIVLGDFEHYYKTAKTFEGVIDTFVCISKEITQKLLNRLPHRKNEIFQIYFPTPPVYTERVINPSNGPLKLIYVARLEDGKNPLLLNTIDDLLANKNIPVYWNIVGDGPLRDPLVDLVGHKKNFRLHGFLSNEQLHDLYSEQDVFILTSDSEGLPVSLIEAMKTRLVPIVSDITGGVKEIVQDGSNGYRCRVNDAGHFAERIATLYHDPALYDAIGEKALNSANHLFNPHANSKSYWDVFARTSDMAREKKYSKMALSSLDIPWLPNKLVRFIRSFKQQVLQKN